MMKANRFSIPFNIIYTILQLFRLPWDYQFRKFKESQFCCCKAYEWRFRFLRTELLQKYQSYDKMKIQNKPQRLPQLITSSDHPWYFIIKISTKCKNISVCRFVTLAPGSNQFTIYLLFDVIIVSLINIRFLLRLFIGIRFCAKPIEADLDDYGRTGCQNKR